MSSTDQLREQNKQLNEHFTRLRMEVIRLHHEQERFDYQREQLLLYIPQNSDDLSYLKSQVIANENAKQEAIKGYQPEIAQLKSYTKKLEEDIVKLQKEAKKEENT
ncbi:hypothetical protein pb186bvf_007825 [Paramecium bursaria]